MARRRRELQRFFTFGDRVPASVGLVLALMLATSVWGWLDAELASLLAFSPVLILRGQIWRLVTWPFLQTDPFGLLFGGFMLWWLGQQLAFVWSERRFLVRFFAYAVFASVVTTFVALAWGPASRPHVGMWPVANALLVSWAMLYPDRQVNIWGVLPVTGKTLALLVLVGTVLYGISSGGFSGLGLFTLHFSAMALAWALSRAGVSSPWTDARRWWADREQRRRASHLKVIRKDGEDEPPRWIN